MKFTIPLLVLSTITSSTCIDFTKWHPPVPGRDLRSPCPALNALANHDIIPHDGRNLTVPMLVKAFGESMNISEDFITFVGNGALKLAPDKGASGSFNLQDISIHGGMEHDASLSRKDFATGDATSFSPTIFKEFLGYMKGAKDVTLQVAADARWGRVKTESKRDKKFQYREDDRLNSYIQSVIYRQSLVAPNGSVPIDWVKIWFSEERLPWKEGWRPTQSPVDKVSLLADVLKLSLATPEESLNYPASKKLHPRFF